MDLGHSFTSTRAWSLMAKLGTATLVVAILSRARPVLLPVAFAAVLAFILTPPMKWLQRRLSRLPALALVMLLAISALGSAGYVLASELNDLTTQLGEYTESMRRKVAALQIGGGPLARVEVMMARIAEGLERQKQGGAIDRAVRLVPADLSPAAHLWSLFKPLAEPLITVLFVLVLCIFMLGQRDDLRNRLIRLVGTGHVTSTTRTLDEGAQRITRYLLDQTMINAVFGAVVGLGLWALGIPYAVLWGAVAVLARFVPYLGAAASMLMPAALAFAIFPGWTRTLLTMGLFLGMDAITAYAIEPLLIGRRTGVSSIALLVSALFWTWLWGPLGLALATPITVSLLVLSRHVPDLQLLGVVLGDDQVIGTEISFYQRLLARDEDEAGEIAQAQLAEHGPVEVMDRIIIPTLALAARDLARKEITAEDQAFIVSWSRDIFEHLGPAEGQPGDVGSTRALGVAAHGNDGQLLLEMLASGLAPEHGRLEVVPAATPLSEVTAWVERLAPVVVCVAALPPEGGPSARQLCHRLKGRFPGLTVIAFRPDEPGVDPARATARLREAGADSVTSTLAQASAQLSERLGRGELAPQAARSEPRPSALQGAS